jgi:hypothetical protein
MTTTTVGLFDDFESAEQVVSELTAAGIPRSHISVIANRDKCGPNIGPIEDIGADTSVAGPAAKGGAIGFAAGLVALAIPGVGPVLALGPLAAGLIGAAAGGLIGRLRDEGVSAEDADCFCEAVRRGGVLLSVNTSEEMAERAEDIIGRGRTVDLDQCAVEWRKAGWTGTPPADNAKARPSSTGDKPKALDLDPFSVSEKRKRRSVYSYPRVS